MIDLRDVRVKLRQQFRWLSDKGIAHSIVDLDGWWDDPDVVASMGRVLADLFTDAAPTVVLAPAASGYLLGPLVAADFGVRFVGVAKDPGTSMSSDRWTTITTPPDYKDRHLVLGWRSHRVAAGDRVLAVDDIVETGGQLSAIKSGVERVGAQWLGAAVLIDMLHGHAHRRELGVRSVFNERDLR